MEEISKQDKQYTSRDEVILNKIRMEIKKRSEDVEKEKISIQIAMKHQLATRVGRDKRYDELTHNEQIAYCQCCARQIQKIDTPISIDTIDLAFLGSAYVSYLEFIKFCIKLLMAFFLSSGLFNIITNSAFGEDCISPTNLDDKSLSDQSTECIRNWVTMYSLGNKRSRRSLMISQSFFNLLSILICVVLFQKFRFRLRQIEEECDEREINASDYTLLISNIPDEFVCEGDPSKIDYESLLKKFLHKNLAQKQESDVAVKIKQDLKEKQNGIDSKNKNTEHMLNLGEENDKEQYDIENMLKEESLVEIVSVGLCFDLKKFYTLDNNITNLQKKISRCKKESEKEKLIDLLNKQRQTRDIFSRDYKEVGKNKYKINNFTGYAYVVLQYEQDQERVTEYYKQIEFLTSLMTGRKTQKIKFENNELSISAAPDPNNIFWQNLRHSSGALLVRRTALFLATLLVLGGCLGLLFSFQLLQMKVGAEENKDSSVVSILSFIISVSIILLNAGVQQSIFMIASKEARSTKIGFFDSVVVKHAVAHFLNTSVFIYTDGDGYGKLFKAGGLAYNMNSIFMTNMVVQNIVQALNIPYYLAQSIQQGFKKLENSDKLQKLVASQEALNAYFENPIFDLQRQYSIIISSIFSALFYAPIIPFCLVWTIIQLFMKYWVDKYSIIKKSTINVGPNINLCLDVLENLEYSLPIYSLSNLIFFVYISKSNDVDQLSILGVLIGLIHAILPMQFFNEKLYKIENTCNNEKRYEDVCLSFITDYDRENPVKRVQAMKNHYKALKQKARAENKLDLDSSIYTDQMVENSSPSPINRNQGLKLGENRYGPSKFGSKFQRQQSDPDELFEDENVEQKKQNQDVEEEARFQEKVDDVDQDKQQQKSAYNLNCNKIINNPISPYSKVVVVEATEKNENNYECEKHDDEKTNFTQYTQNEINPKAYTIHTQKIQEDEIERQQNLQTLQPEQKLQCQQNEQNYQTKCLTDSNPEADSHTLIELQYLQPYSKYEENEKVNQSPKQTTTKRDSISRALNENKINYKNEDESKSQNKVDKQQDLKSKNENENQQKSNIKKNSKDNMNTKNLQNQIQEGKEIKSKNSGIHKNKNTTKDNTSKKTEDTKQEKKVNYKKQEDSKHPLELSELNFVEEIKFNKSTLNFSPSEIVFTTNQAENDRLKSHENGSKYFSNINTIPSQQSANQLLPQENNIQRYTIGQYKLSQLE